MSTTSTLVDLTSESNKIVIDAVATANRRAVAYYKGLWNIVSRPFPSKDLKDNVGEGFERAEQIVDLTIQEMEADSKLAIEFAEKALAQATKAREEAVNVAREYAKTGVSTLKSALESTESTLKTALENTETRLEDFSKRLEDVSTIAPAPKKAKSA